MQMLMPNVNELRFESTQDIVDYTSRNFIPREDEFHEVMLHFHNPDTGPRDISTEKVYISADIVPQSDETREAVANVLERVYENRKHNRRNIMITAGVIAAVIIGGHVFLFSHHHKKEKEELNAYRAVFSDSVSMTPPTPVL